MINTPSTPRKIPIVVLTRDNSLQLAEMIRSIEERTKYPYQLYICDNNSQDSQQHELLESVSSKGHIVLRNKSNRWILGLNPALEMIDLDYPDAQFIAISDDDIVVPEPFEELCWLSKLVETLQSSPYLGKLGLGLSWINLVGQHELSSVLADEARFKKQLMQPGVWNAAVDTTMALYRKDIFITKQFRFRPGHNSYTRPYYHQGRLPEPYEGIHLGWNHYAQKTQSLSQINAKVWCFTKYAGYVHPLVLQKCHVTTRIGYKVLGKLFRAIWGAKLVWAWLYFIFERKIIYQNKIFRDIREGST